MKITNLILNIANAVLLYLWGLIPFIIGFFGSLIQIVFTDDHDGGLMLAGFTGCLALALATATIPLSIIAFNKARRGRKKPYIIIESILIGLSLITYILAIPSVFGFESLGRSNGSSDFVYLIVFPVFGIIVDMALTVFTVLIGVLKGRPAQQQAVMTAPYGQPYQEFRQPYLQAGQQPQAYQPQQYPQQPPQT